jgi:hypothetical protein
MPASSAATEAPEEKLSGELAAAAAGGLAGSFLINTTAPLPATAARRLAINCRTLGLSFNLDIGWAPFLAAAMQFNKRNDGRKKQKQKALPD